MEIYLRAFEMKDLELLNRWHNDSEINTHTGGRKYFVSPDYDRKWLEEKIFNNQNQVYCAICEQLTSKMVGYISLNDIDLINRHAFWGGILIGDKNYRNKGVATQAAIKLLKYGFFEIGLNKIHGRWLTENKTSIFLGQMLGFRKDGLLRKEVFKNNQYYDVLIMSILKEEFEQKLTELER